MCIRRFLTKRFYYLWIKKIAQGEHVEDLENHIIKHANELLDSQRDKTSWAASMHNLLDIYETKYGVTVDKVAQISKLQRHYLKNPDTRTAPPGGKIPGWVTADQQPKLTTTQKME